ncbi:PREDICTED: fas-binding factor 1 [Elephantulus edwardii]|uniref:fas-binding factor 1 n=1 Tax=Elephantulus edwardii TaxID=28737 RepID=UPI0003F06AD2|nr:PREDICTED: fas-binding factor 1 [Elephantulus edwardii]
MEAAKTKKGLKDSIDDVLGDLLGDDMDSSEKPVKLAPRTRDAPGGSRVLPSRVRTKSLLEGDFCSTMAGLVGADAEVSDVSDADPEALLQAMQDMDDMDADLLGLKKSNLTSSKTAARGSGKEELPSVPKSTGNKNGVEDPLAGLLSDDEDGVAKKAPVVERKTASNKTLSATRDQDGDRNGGPSVPLTPGSTPLRRKEELTFDDGDDIMASLGFGDNPTADKGQMGDQGGPRPARAKLDELLGRGTAAALLARPGTGEHREFKLDRKYRRPQEREDTWGEEDFTFGAYQPTVGSSEGRQSRRQSVSRFLAESSTDPRGDLGSRQSTPASSSPIHPRKGAADWLGLKDDELDLLPPSPTRETQRGGSALSTLSVPPPARQHSTPAGLPTSGAKPPSRGAPSKASQASKPGASEDTEEDWLSHALSRKKSQGLVREEQDLNWTGPPSSLPPAPTDLSVQLLEQLQEQQHWQCRLPSLESQELTICLPSSQQPPGVLVPNQSLPPESRAPSQLLGTEYQRQLQAAQAQLQGSTAQLQAELLRSQARLAELEAQVRKLELERTQHTLLLESLQQRHQADLELIESAHRNRVKMLETSYQQREERLRRENEELSARYLSHCQEAELARAELTAQHQRRLAAAAQEKDQEMERLRELQRASILEMRKDHQEQLQRVKLLKDQEIDAVTSATSHTRSLNGVIEQMEKFSSSLNELSSRVEASHLSTSQERELGVRLRDEQLRALQERLARQQRDMEEERARLQEVLAKMEMRLGEQSRLLEQERWRVSAEQSKAESTQRSLEEQRKVMVQQTAMEREELERAKSALLEEQKSVMHKCAEERRRLAAEWAEFYAQQKLSKERAEREVERALQVDTHREGALVSLAKEQAELKIRASELRVKEDQLAAEREALERERQELRLEKERVNAAALRVQLRAEEVEGMSKVASEKYEAGERALREARQVQSEHQVRLQQVQQQQERLRQQEQHVHQEHLSLAQQRLQLDRVRQDLPSGITGLLPRLQDLAAPSLIATGTPATTNLDCSRPAASLGPAHLYAKLVLLKHTAEQDRDFLENEQFFLETLKKAPYNVTSHSA